MINEYAGQLIAHCFCQHNGCDGGINSTRQSTQNFTIANLLTDRFDAVLCKCIHGPVAGASAYIVYKVVKHLASFLGMQHLWMELNSVQVLLLPLSCCHRAVWGVSYNTETRSDSLNVIIMAHPADRLF